MGEEFGKKGDDGWNQDIFSISIIENEAIYSFIIYDTFAPFIWKWLKF